MAFVGTFMVLVQLVQAQDSSSTGVKDVDSTAGTDKPPLTAGQLADQPEIRQLGSANLLSSDVSLFHFGPLHVASVEFSQAYDGIGSDTSHLLSTFRTGLVAEHTLHRSRLALQYSPRLTIADGQVLQNFSNQDSSLDTLFMLSPRLSVAIYDQFQLLRTTNLDSDSFLSADPI